MSTKASENHKSFIVDLQFSVKTVFSEEQIRDLRELACTKKTVVNKAQKHLQSVARSAATDDEFLSAFQKAIFREAIKQVIADEIVDGTLIKNLSPVKVTVTNRK